MKLTIEIDMDGAAFEDNPYEIERVLATVGQRVRWSRREQDGPVITYDQYPDRRVKDVNGNTVGRFTITEG